MNWYFDLDHNKNSCLADIEQSNRSCAGAQTVGPAGTSFFKPHTKNVLGESQDTR